MKREYFYWATSKKVATVFGAMFNNIQVGRRTSDGKLSNVTEVPLSYGPRAKFLSRIRENKEQKISIQLPRMSYQIVDFTHDQSRAIAPTQKYKFPNNKTAFTAVPYELGFELVIYGRTLDDVLQIIEQILPSFRPEYTVAIKDLEGPDTITDVPFKLNGITSVDEYEGDWLEARAITKTLTFTANIKYLGPISDTSIIERVEATVRNMNNGEFWEKIVEKVDAPTSFVSMIDPNQEYSIVVTNTTGFLEGENIIGQTSGYGALILEVVDGTTLRVGHVENTFTLNENIIGENSGTVQELLAAEIIS